MNKCPPAIAAILCKIIEHGLLSIRQYGWHNDAARCAIEADHIHFLPSLLIDFNPGVLEYYWSGMRVGYIQQTEGNNIDTVKDLWEALEPHIEHATDLTANA